MLIHVSRFNTWQKDIASLTDRKLKEYQEAIQNNDPALLADLRTIWEADYVQLTADLSADTSAITGDALLRSKITTSVTATSGSTTLPTTGAKTRITSADQNVAVSVRFTFDPGTENQDAQNQSINLAAFALKLEQSRT